MLLVAQLPVWMTGILIALFLFVCLLMILVVLIQRPAGGGLSGAFGSGAGSGQTAFGAKTGDALTIATVAVFFIYLLFAIGLNFAARPSGALSAPAPVPGLPGTAPIGGDMDERPPGGIPAAPTGLPLETDPVTSPVPRPEGAPADPDSSAQPGPASPPAPPADPADPSPAPSP